jgi:hypothetical protein
MGTAGVLASRGVEYWMPGSRALDGEAEEGGLLQPGPPGAPPPRSTRCGEEEVEVVSTRGLRSELPHMPATPHRTCRSDHARAMRQRSSSRPPPPTFWFVDKNRR